MYILAYYGILKPPSFIVVLGNRVWAWASGDIHWDWIPRSAIYRHLHIDGNRESLVRRVASWLSDFLTLQLSHEWNSYRDLQMHATFWQLSLSKRFSLSRRRIPFTLTKKTEDEFLVNLHVPIFLEYCLFVCMFFLAFPNHQWVSLYIYPPMLVKLDLYFVKGRG